MSGKTAMAVLPVLPKNLVRGEEGRVMGLIGENGIGLERALQELKQYETTARNAFCLRGRRQIAVGGPTEDDWRQAARVYRWCRPPTCGIATTRPSEGGSTRRGVGALRSRDKCARAW